jgi:serine protease AprX
MRNANFSGSIGATVSGTAARALAAAVRYLLPLTLSIALAGIAFAGPKLAPDLKGNSGDMMDVIVQFKNPPTKQQLKQLGAYGRMKKVFDGINAAHLTLPLSVIEAIENDPSITYISPNRPTAGSLDVVDPTVNATFAWQYGFDGTGVGVAIIDSGVSLKRDLLNRDNLSSRVVYSESFVAGEDPSDLYGHGTHVAGIVGGSGADSSGSTFTRTFRGVAPNANIINLKVLDLNGMGNDSDVISAIQRAIQLKNTYNIRIMNLSLGRPVYESYKLDPLCQAVEQAWKAGIVVVLAAGNYGRDDNRRTKGYGTIASPGNDPYVITVGATTTNGTVSRLDDKVATFSSKGPTLVDHIVKPDLVAPGNNVVSLLSSPTCTLVTKYPRTQVNTATYETLGTYGTTMGSYFRLSGTSMATPVVSGAAALLLQKQPTLTPDQIKARLMKTATKVMPLYSSGTDLISKATYNLQSDIFTVGSGYLDIAAALANNDLVALPALSPTAVYDASTKMVGVLRDLSVVWGDSVIWGDSVVWGNAVFNGTVLGTSVCWGSSVVWGDTTLAGFSVVWGDTVLGTAAPLEASSADNGDADPTVDSVTGQ